MTHDNSKSGLAVLLALITVASVLAVPVAATPAEDLNFDGDAAAPNPYFDVETLTVARHPADKGLTDSDMAGVYDDNGDWISDPAFEVNTSARNPYTFNPVHIEDDGMGVFPRGEEAASALDASEWSKSGAQSSKLTVEDTSVAEGADAVRIYTDGSMGSGDHAVATYANWTDQLDNDEAKRVLQLGGDLDTLDSGTTVYINITDEDGDKKVVKIDSGLNESDDNVFATGTGSHLIQVKMNDLSTTGGTFDNIEEINVNVTDGDVDLSLSWVDLEDKGKTDLGTKTVDNDGDGDYDESKTHYDAHGKISVNSMESVSSEFDDAVFNDVEMPAHFEASMLDGSEGEEGVYMYEWAAADQYPGYDQILDVYYRIELPSYIDLSYSNADLVIDQEWPEGRYVTFEYGEGVSDSTNFSDASLSSVSDILGASGETQEIDNTVQIGTGYVVHTELKVTSDEKSGIVDVSGGAAPPSDGGGGLWGFLTSIPGMLISGAIGILGFRWLKQ